jgi:hypothetical protein
VKNKSFKLIEMNWPDFGVGDPPPPAGLAEIKNRISLVRARMEQKGFSHLIVYGDREHFANIMYVTGLDPRYEEAILILGLDQDPLLLLGNECYSYAKVSPLYRSGEMRTEKYQPLSLLNQPRDESRMLKEIILSEGIRRTSIVGCVGWKYFAADEHPDCHRAMEIPSFIVDTLRETVCYENIKNATDIFMNPENGLRTFASPTEIAYFEYTNSSASEGVKNMIFNLREGMRDSELASFCRFNGYPLSCHMTLLTGATRELGLTGPVGAIIRRGDPLAMNLGYWGSNVCRAGWAVSSSRELPSLARSYVDSFAGRYFEVMYEWFQLLRIGIPGRALWQLIHEKLPEEIFGISLNPGHLIHLDEWLSSPVFRDSSISLHSGMVVQSDVIPVSPHYFSTRMEDGYVIADVSLRRQIQQEYPETYARCLRRRDFVNECLGFDLADEVLPLSNMPAIVPPYFFAPNTIFALEE